VTVVPDVVESLHGNSYNVARIVRWRQQLAHCLIAVEHFAHGVRAGSDEHGNLPTVLPFTAQLLRRPLNV